MNLTELGDFQPKTTEDSPPSNMQEVQENTNEEGQVKSEFDKSQTHI